MCRRLLWIWAVAAVMLSTSFTANAQCERVGIVGEFTGWGADEPDHMMTRNSDAPAEFTTIITLTEEQDASDPTDGVIELKFRADQDWSVNWGDTTFPSGTATPDGPNLMVPYGSYYVTFNCETGAYSWTETCGDVGIVGAFSGWGEMPDHVMTRDDENLDLFSTDFHLQAPAATPTDTVVELKFRSNMMWTVNWGSEDGFPSGTAEQDGPNLVVPVGDYHVTFNCATGEYSFTEQCGQISVIGEFVEWSDDVNLNRSETDPAEWSGMISFPDDADSDENGIIEVKFRQNADWGVNWGGEGFPDGTAVQDGANIELPVDNMGGLATEYFVTFNCETGAYSFQSTCGEVSLIGEFFNWSNDAPMQRMEDNPNMHRLSRSFYAEAQGKFRENRDWSVNWGEVDFPTGTASPNGPNIIIEEGKYDITFNCATGDYNFAVNNDLCGEVGIVGDFNNFGTPDDPANPPTDLYLHRDPNSPNDFYLEHNFTTSTRAIFRSDADVAFIDVWGGDGFPTGTGVAGDPAAFLNIPGGSYFITFNCLSGDYDFQRLGSSVTANQVFAMTVDGFLDENDWDIGSNVSKVVAGEAGDDPVEGNFGVVFTEDQLIIGVDVTDASVEDGDLVHVFVDGDKSGGDYTDSDIYFTVAADGTVDVVTGNMAVPVAFANEVGSGYSVEAAVNWADLGVEAATGGGIGLDIGITDFDGGAEQATAIWNGNLENLTATGALGDCIFGELNCGTVSLWSPSIGDVGLNNPADLPTDYIATYELEGDMELFFRKDGSNTVQWGTDAFPMGTAEVGGLGIPATAGRYRVSFNCLTGDYNFESEPVDNEVAFARFTENAVAIDGDLSEFNLEYGFDAGAVDPVGADINNTASWGALWDENSLYLGVQVEDAVVEGSGDPWTNDGVEFYVDGNHTRGISYDGDFDQQMIVDFANGSTIWTKGDGAPIDPATEIEGVFTETANGYNIELRVDWAPFSFVPGRNRSIGFTVAYNDSDNGAGRDYQAAWAGNSDNFQNTSAFGDLQLADGPLVDVEDIYLNEHIGIFPNPTPASSRFYITSDGEVFSGEVFVEMYNMMGQLVHRENIDFTGTTQVQVNIADLSTGQYIVHIIDTEGQRAMKKLIVE